ncbi:hypothetical protein E2C01_077456 [Portunus trituberculatus]|uniref:Uncharacterized protein n=1 Tax=Portunus trituberculatus TaxID=210409 RepID=A0A5B7IRD6_PORTR|nr:hypothetical protein [Portunus trituberculatus]
MPPAARGTCCGCTGYGGRSTSGSGNGSMQMVL